MNGEATWLLALLRGEAPTNHESLDWSLVLDLARRHQVDAMCSWMLRKNAEAGQASYAALPDRLKSPLRRSYLHHLLRNEALFNDLSVIDAHLTARGISRLYLKGPWLAAVAYPDPGTRPIGDVDLLVREQDYHGTVEALFECGYSPDSALPDSPRTALRRAHYGRQIRFAAPGRRPVELHFRLINIGPPSGDESWVWATARSFVSEQGTFPVPGPEAMLLHLLIHANQHGYTVLRLLYDLRWALAQDGARLDPARLLAQIRRLRCTTSSYFGLLLATEMAGAPRQVFQDELRPSVLRRVGFETVWRLRSARRLVAVRRAMETESPLVYLSEFGTITDKCRYLAGVVAEADGPAAFLRRVVRLLSGRSIADRVSS